MPLPNLEFKVRPNGGGGGGGGSQSSTVPELGPNSYREQVRDRLQNTPRGAAETDDHTAKIDLSLFGSNDTNSSSYYRPVSRNGGQISHARLASVRGSHEKASTNSSLKRQIVFYNKTYVPSSSDAVNNDEDDNDDVVTHGDEDNQQSYDNINRLANNSQKNSRKQNEDIYQRFKSTPGTRSSLVMDQNNNEINLDRPVPTPRRRQTNQNFPLATLATSRPNSRQQTYRSIPGPVIAPPPPPANHSNNQIQSIYNQIQQNRPNQQQNQRSLKDNDPFRSMVRRNNRLGSSQELNADSLDMSTVDNNNNNNNKNVVSYVIDHFRTSSNSIESMVGAAARSRNEFHGYTPSRTAYNHDDDHEGFEVESVHDEEIPVPKPRQHQIQPQQSLIPNKIGLRYELASSSGANDSVNLRMRRNNANRPITPRTGPFTSSTIKKIRDFPQGMERSGDENEQRRSSLFNPKSKNGSNNLETKRIELTQQYIKFQTQMSPIITKKGNGDEYFDSQSIYFEN